MPPKSEEAKQRRKVLDSARHRKNAEAKRRQKEADIEEERRKADEEALEQRKKEQRQADVNRNVRNFRQRQRNMNNNNDNNNEFETPGRGRAAGNAQDITPETLHLMRMENQTMQITDTVLKSDKLTAADLLQLQKNNISFHQTASTRKLNKSQRDLNVATNASKADLVKEEKGFAEVFTNMEEYQASAYMASNYNKSASTEEEDDDEEGAADPKDSPRNDIYQYNGSVMPEPTSSALFGSFDTASTGLAGTKSSSTSKASSGTAHGRKKQAPLTTTASTGLAGTTSSSTSKASSGTAHGRKKQAPLTTAPSAMPASKPGWFGGWFASASGGGANLKSPPSTKLDAGTPMSNPEEGESPTSQRFFPLSPTSNSASKSMPPSSSSFKEEEIIDFLEAQRTELLDLEDEGVIVELILSTRHTLFEKFEDQNIDIHGRVAQKFGVEKVQGLDKESIIEEILKQVGRMTIVVGEDRKLIQIDRPTNLVWSHKKAPFEKGQPVLVRAFAKDQNGDPTGNELMILAMTEVRCSSTDCPLGDDYECRCRSQNKTLRYVGADLPSFNRDAMEAKACLAPWSYNYIDKVGKMFQFGGVLHTIEAITAVEEGGKGVASYSVIEVDTNDLMFILDSEMPSWQDDESFYFLDESQVGKTTTKESKTTAGTKESKTTKSSATTTTKASKTTNSKPAATTKSKTTKTQPKSATTATTKASKTTKSATTATTNATATTEAPRRSGRVAAKTSNTGAGAPAAAAAAAAATSSNKSSRAAGAVGAVSRSGKTKEESRLASKARAHERNEAEKAKKAKEAAEQAKKAAEDSQDEDDVKKGPKKGTKKSR